MLSLAGVVALVAESLVKEESPVEAGLLGEVRGEGLVVRRRGRGRRAGRWGTRHTGGGRRVGRDDGCEGRGWETRGMLGEEAHGRGRHAGRDDGCDGRGRRHMRCWGRRRARGGGTSECNASIYRGTVGAK